MSRHAIAVLGLSTFGTALVRHLAPTGCHLLAADIDEKRVEAVRDLVHEPIVGDVRDRRALERLSLHEYRTVVLSLGEPLDASLLAVLHLRDLGVGNILARAVSEDHRRLLLKLGAHRVVFPEIDMAERFARILSSEGLWDTVSLDEELAVVEVEPQPWMVGKTLAALDLPRRFRLRVLGLRDALTKAVQLNPHPGTPVTQHTILIVFGRDADIDQLLAE